MLLDEEDNRSTLIPGPTPSPERWWVTDLLAVRKSSNLDYPGRPFQTSLFRSYQTPGSQQSTLS